MPATIGNIAILLLILHNFLALAAGEANVKCYQCTELDQNCDVPDVTTKTCQTGKGCVTVIDYNSRKVTARDCHQNPPQGGCDTPVDKSSCYCKSETCNRQSYNELAKNANKKKTISCYQCSENNDGCNDPTKKSKGKQLLDVKTVQCAVCKTVVEVEEKKGLDLLKKGKKVIARGCHDSDEVQDNTCETDPNNQKNQICYCKNVDNCNFKMAEKTISGAKKISSKKYSKGSASICQSSVGYFLSVASAALVVAVYNSVARISA